MKAFFLGATSLPQSPVKLGELLEECVRNEDLESAMEVFRHVRRIQGRDLGHYHPQQRQRMTGGEAVRQLEWRMAGEETENAPEQGLLPRPFTPLILALSLGRTAFVQTFLRQPEVDLHTKIWAGCYLQVTHLVQDLLRELDARHRDTDTTWTRLWASCAIGRAEAVTAILASLDTKQVGLLLNQGHEFDGLTPLGVSLHFGHHETVSLPLLLRHSAALDLTRTDLKGRSYLHLATFVLVPSSRNTRDVADRKLGRFHAKILPDLITALLGVPSGPQHRHGHTHAHQSRHQDFQAVVDPLLETPVKGKQLTVLQILVDHLTLFPSDLRRHYFLLWRHLHQPSHDQDDHGHQGQRDQQENVIRETIEDLEKSQKGLCESLKRIFFHPGVVERLPLVTYAALCDEVGKNGAWGNRSMLEALMAQVTSREWLQTRHLGAIFTNACQLGSTEIACFVLTTISSQQIEVTQLSPLSAQILAGVKLAVVFGHEDFLLSLFDSLAGLVDRHGKFAADWNSPKPDGIPLLHLLINFGLSAAFRKLISLPFLAAHLDLNRQSDLRTSRDIERDDLVTTTKIHRTVCLTPCLAAVRTKWLKAAMQHYDDLLRPQKQESQQGLQPAFTLGQEEFECRARVPSKILDGRADILACLLANERVSLRLQGLGNESLVIHEAARCGNFAAVQRLLEACPSLDVNQVDYLGRSVLHFAVAQAHTSTVQALLRLGGSVDVNQRTRYMSFPLQIAVERNLTDIARILLAGPSSHLIDPNLPIFIESFPSPTASHGFHKPKNEADNTMVDVFSLASQMSHEEVATPRSSWASRQTSLHVACSVNHYEIVRALVGHPTTELNATSDQGQTALCVAASAGALECVRELLAHRDIDLLRVDREGNAPLHLAAKNEHADVVALLLDAMDISQVGEDFLETVIRFCPGVLRTRFEGCAWKETLSRASSEFCYVCDWRNAFLSEGMPASLPPPKREDKQRGNLSRPEVRVAFLLDSVVAYRADELLETPLVRTVLDVKWRSYQVFGHLALVLYLLYLACFTLLALTTSPSSAPLAAAAVFSPPLGTALQLTLLSLSSLLLGFELFSLVAVSEVVANDWVLPLASQRLLFRVSLVIRKAVSYLRRPLNWLKLFSFVTSFFLALHLTFPAEVSAPTASRWIGQENTAGPVVLPACFLTTAVPLALLAAWLTTLSFLRSVTFFGLRVGLHAQMYLQVLRSMLPSVLVFAVLLCGFGTSLILLTSQTAGTPFSDPLAAQNPSGLATAGAAVVASLKVLVFTGFGDLQFLEQVSSPSYPEATQVGLVVLILFLVMVPLVAFNFLVALAVGDVNSLLSQAKTEELRGRAKTVATLDHLLSTTRLLSFLRVRLPDDGRIYPNRRGPVSLLLSFLGVTGEDALCPYDIPARPTAPGTQRPDGSGMGARK